MSVAWPAVLESKKLVADASLVVIVAWPAVLLSRKFMKPALKPPAVSTTWPRMNCAVPAELESLKSIAGITAHSTHYIERRRICETGDDALAVDVVRSKRH